MLGFRITSIALAGQRQLTREEILTTAGVTGRTSLLFLDATDARARLKANPWIAEATVLKLYPGRLHIAVTEREAFALWQKDGKVSVIADDGTVVEPYVVEALRRAAAGGGRRRRDPGQGFPRRCSTNIRCCATSCAPPSWSPSGAGTSCSTTASTCGCRKPTSSRRSTTLVQLDRDKKLLSRDIAAIDLRLPDRVTVRLSDEACAARQEALKDKKAKKKARRRMSLHDGFTPKMKPVSPRRTAIVAVLDIGTSKIVCLIARLKPQAPQEVLRRRSHGIEILGIGHTESARHQERRRDQSGGGRGGGAPRRRSRRARRLGAA